MAKQKLSTRDALKLLKNARFREDNLGDLALSISSKSLPEKYYTSAFEVFHSHLKVPLVQATLDNKTMCRLVISSLLGLGALSDAYFSKHEAQLRDCWPDIINWSKAILRGRRYNMARSLDLAGAFFYAIGQIFDVVSFTDVELANNEDVFPFAVELWKGDEEHTILPDRYATKPLLACLSTDEDQVKTFCERSAYNPNLLVDVIFARFSTAVASTPKRKLEITADLSDLLSRFIQCGLKPIYNILRHSFGSITILCYDLNALLDDASQTPEHDYTLHCSFDVLCTLFYSSTTMKKNALRAGFLRVLVAVAADPKKYEFGERPTHLLSSLRCDLLGNDIISATLASMKRLASNVQIDLPRLLRSTTSGFQNAWKLFESTLLENAVIFELFGHGYVEERGKCASCRKRSGRKSLRKCAGCGAILYCSQACERDDWPRHRVDCASVEKDIEKYFDSTYSRLSRRLATLQVSRFWPGIVSFARSRDIPIEYLGVRLRHDSAHYKFDVFDCRKVDEDDYWDEYRRTPFLSLLAKESLRARVEENENSCILLVLTYMDVFDVPYLVYLESDFDTDTAMASHCRSMTCLDEDNNVLLPRTQDLVEDIMSRLYASPNLDWRARWIERPFVSLARQAALKFK
ncbi:hypothetical protein SCHPADRAFT_925334 [Schizopora paradoxa]|uniref:MYND-type domain-containing protein n=1 Tax=Schizopora paradoxa TaxID=27342 RepID=A0A0H2S917_9AGAM|nr:hypothetical protein SCHPADRAFT_925334 [Schizopora paradoxa]